MFQFNPHPGTVVGKQREGLAWRAPLFSPSLKTIRYGFQQASNHNLLVVRNTSYRFCSLCSEDVSTTT
jgi:hypothetical protein